MEKTIKWEGPEVGQMQALDYERTQVLAKIGALMMDLEAAKKNLESVNEKQGAAIKQALTNRGITQFESARPVPGGLSITLPEIPGNINGGV